MNTYIDHTNLKPTATVEDITKLCQEAIEHNFYAVCVNGNYIHYAIDQLKDTEIKVAAVAGFPLGSNTLNAKLNEVDLLVAAGADCLKVILETCYLTDEEIIRICEIAKNEGIDFVKTSTGFGTAGATLRHVQIMKDTVGDKVKIKASGGIRDAATAQQYIDAGVSRIGTSSGVKIVGG